MYPFGLIFYLQFRYHLLLAERTKPRTNDSEGGQIADDPHAEMGLRAGHVKELSLSMVPPSETQDAECSDHESNCEP